MSSGECVQVYWPRGQRQGTIDPLAPRLATLQGRKVAFLWDYLFRGDEIFPLIERELRARFDGVECVGYEVFGSTHGEDERAIVETLPARLRELGVDAVVSGIGC